MLFGSFYGQILECHGDSLQRVVGRLEVHLSLHTSFASTQLRIPIIETKSNLCNGFLCGATQHHTQWLLLVLQEQSVMGSLQTILVYVDIYGLWVRSQELLKTDSSFKQVLGGYQKQKQTPIVRKVVLRIHGYGSRKFKGLVLVHNQNSQKIEKIK